MLDGESATDAFLRPKLSGGRFEGGGIPLDFLKDMAVLKEMIIEVAKWRFLQENPDRQRSPRGFTDGVELKLSGIESGSAVPVIELSLTTPQISMFPPQNLTYFEQSRDFIVSAISVAERDEPNEIATRYLPESALAYFNRLGRGLRGEECVEFVTPSNLSTARLTRETRRRLLLASSRVMEITEEVELRGSIPEADQERMTFQMQLVSGSRTTSPIPDQHLDVILEGFSGYRDNTRVVLQGVGRYNRQGRLVGVESVEHIGLLDPLDVPACLDEFRILKDGWLNGEGSPPSHEGLDWLAESFERCYPDAPLPYVYPTVEGGVQMEWSLGSKEISLEITLANHSAEWFWTDVASDDENERTLDLNAAADWEWIADEIRRLAETAA